MYRLKIQHQLRHLLVPDPKPTWPPDPSTYQSDILIGVDRKDRGSSRR